MNKTAVVVYEVENGAHGFPEVAKIFGAFCGKECHDAYFLQSPPNNVKIATVWEERVDELGPGCTCMLCEAYITSPIPKFDFHVASSAEEPHVVVFSTLPDGSQDYELVRIPILGGAQGIPEATAQLITAALNHYGENTWGWEDWKELVGLLDTRRYFLNRRIENKEEEF